MPIDLLLVLIFAFEFGAGYAFAYVQHRRRIVQLQLALKEARIAAEEWMAVAERSADEAKELRGARTRKLGQFAN